MRASLIRRGSGEVVVPEVRLAVTFFSRLRGLQFQPPLPPECGLLLAPCGSIHTHWLRFPIDVAMIDDGGKVLLVRRFLRPWRMLPGPKGTACVLETAAGCLKLSEADEVQLVLESFPAVLPAGLHRLQHLLGNVAE